MDGLERAEYFRLCVVRFPLPGEDHCDHLAQLRHDGLAVEEREPVLLLLLLLRLQLCVLLHLRLRLLFGDLASAPRHDVHVAVRVHDEDEVASRDAEVVEEAVREARELVRVDGAREHEAHREHAEEDETRIEDPLRRQPLEDPDEDNGHDAGVEGREERAHEKLRL